MTSNYPQLPQTVSTGGSYPTSTSYYSYPQTYAGGMTPQQSLAQVQAALQQYTPGANSMNLSGMLSDSGNQQQFSQANQFLYSQLFTPEMMKAMQSGLQGGAGNVAAMGGNPASVIGNIFGSETYLKMLPFLQANQNKLAGSYEAQAAGNTGLYNYLQQLNAQTAQSLYTTPDKLYPSQTQYGGGGSGQGSSGQAQQAAGNDFLSLPTWDHGGTGNSAGYDSGPYPGPSSPGGDAGSYVGVGAGPWAGGYSFPSANPSISGGSTPMVNS